MGEITLPSDILPNTKKDVILSEEQLSKTFDALVSENNPIFLSMLAYVFHRAIPNNKRSPKMKEAKRQIPRLLQYDDAQFEKLKDREQGLIDLITEKEIDKYFKHYLEEIEKTDMLNLMQSLSTTDYFSEGVRKDKDGTQIPITSEPLKLNTKKLQNFKLTEVGNQSAIERLVDITERGQELDEKGSERTGELMSAIDSSKPILYDIIKNYFEYSPISTGALVTLDTKQYMNDVFVKEGFGSFDSEEFPFSTGVFGSKTITEAGETYEGEKYEAKTKTFSEKDKRENIPLLHLKLIGDKGAGKYEQGKDKFLVEGLTGSKSFDTLEEAYDAINEISTKPKLLQRYLEKTIMSQDKHPLKNVILGYLSAERRELKLGELTIEVSKTKEGSSKDKNKWVESTRVKLNIVEDDDVELDSNTEKVGGIIFNIMKNFTKIETVLLESLIDNETKNEKSGFEIIEEEVSDKEKIDENKESWDKIVSEHKLLKNKLDIALIDILDEYRILENSNEFNIEKVRLYAKDLMSKSSSKSGFSAGKSRIPILYADVIYNMNMLLDTTPKNYKFKLKPDKRDKSKAKPTGVNIVQVQKDFLNIKRGYNSLKALVRGN